MVTYIVRRLITAALILLGASFLVYLLTAASGDPLEEFRASSAPNKQQLMDARIELLQLDTPAPIRYFQWLGGAAQCLIPFADSCDLGKNIAGQPITDALGHALVQTLTLVTGATVLAILIGITLGIITALRQYSTLDYGVTFMAFLFFSLPIFWVAVLLKEFGAIGFNNFLRNPEIPMPAALAIGAVLGVADGRDRRRRDEAQAAHRRRRVPVRRRRADVLLRHRVVQDPGLGPVVIAIAGVGIAFAVTLLSAGLKNRKALQSALIAVGVGAGCLLRHPAAAQRGNVPDDRAPRDRSGPCRGGHRLPDGRLRPRPVHAGCRDHLVPGRIPDPAGPLHAGVAHVLQQQPGPRAAPSPPSAPAPRTSKATSGS